jgi:peptidyl-dipeptidase A
MTDITSVIERAEQELAPLEQEASLASWDVAVAASDEGEQRLISTSLELDAALSDEARHRALTDAGEVGDELLARRVALLRSETTSRQRPRELAERIVRLEAALETSYSTHRGEVDGRPVTDNEIEDVLRDSDDRDARRAFWEASRSIGPVVSDQVRELARLRNESAKQLGFRDHFAMSLELDELDEGWLLGLLDDLEERLAGVWAAEKAEIDADRRTVLGIADSEPLLPWDYADRFFQEATPIAGDRLDAALQGADSVAIALAYFDALGDPMRPVVERSDLYPRDRKNQHAFCAHIDRKHDVRVLANVVPGERWLETMAHELGHAAYDMALDPSLPWLVRRYAHIFTTEAIAMLHGRQPRRAAFLRRFAGVGDEIADDPVNDRVLRRRLLVFVPWVQVMTRFERAMYADPDADLGSIWWQLVQRHQGITPPPGERPHDFATKLHVALAPVYYQNYLLGEVCASQLEWALERETGDISPAAAPEQAGAFLRDRFMSPGARWRWDELMERATGAPLAADHFARTLGA